MKTELEIQRAHDLLTALILREVPCPFDRGTDDNPSEQVRILMANCEVLCWILGHDHVKNFPRNLKALEDWLIEQGYVLGEFEAHSE